MKLLIITFLILFASHSLQASDTVKITVLEETGTFINDKVYLLQYDNALYDYRTVDSFQGSIQFKVPYYPVQLLCRSAKYEDYELVIKTKETRQYNVMMKSNSHLMNEVVVTGVGRPTKLDEAVNAYQIISAEQIKLQGAVTLNDALRNQLGINIGQDQMLGATMSMRGLSGNNVKILIDGLPLNGREGGNIDLSQIDLSNIERIERVQGPMSVMYGTDALGGVINLITKRNRNHWKVGANSYVSSINQYNIGAFAAYKKGKHNLSINGGRNFFGGWDPEIPIKDTRSPLWRPKALLFANVKYIYQLNTRNSISYAGDFTKDLLVIKGDTNDFYLNPYLRVPDAYITTNRQLHRLQGKFFVGKNGYIESNNGYAFYNRNRQGYMTDLTTMDTVLSANPGDNSISEFNTFTSRTTYNNQLNDILNYTFGYDLNYDIASGTERILNGKQQIGDIAAFLTTDIKLVDKLKIQPAIRFIHNTKYKAPISPSIALKYTLHENVKLRASYARGFRAPNIKELFLDFDDSNHKIFGNKNLKAEQGHHFQLSSAFTLLNESKHNSIFTFSGFYDDIHDQIMLGLKDPSAVVDPGQVQEYTYLNFAHVRFLSLQLKHEYGYGNFKFDLGASFNQNMHTTAIIDNGLIFDNPAFAYWEANASLAYTISKYAMTIGAFYKYTGKQRVIGADIMGGAVFGSFMDAYNIIDASVQKSFWKNRVVLQIGGRNLLNVQRLAAGGGGSVHSGASAYVTTGRSFFSTLNIQLFK